MSSQLPTLRSESWTITSFRDSLCSHLKSDKTSELLRMYVYAVTKSGWNELRAAVISWKKQKSNRSATAYVGTDHALTAPEAVRCMALDGVDVRVMKQYSGIFHPKVFWFVGDHKHRLWVGSNNLTRDGLLNNIELGTCIFSDSVPSSLDDWHRHVELGSEPFSEDMLASYESERSVHFEQMAKNKIATFTWSQKLEPSGSDSPSRTAVNPRAQPSTDFTANGSTSPHPLGLPGDLVLEIMPRETSQDGSQVQLPKKIAINYFSLPSVVGTSVDIELSELGGGDFRRQRLTYFTNTTFRLRINELEFSDRPCVIVFRKVADGRYVFQIVSRSIFPQRYKRLLDLCDQRTNPKSRRFGVVK